MNKAPLKRQRTCIACGAQEGKMKLYRFVRDKSGTVSFDPGNRAAGRGAYVCSLECFTKAAASHRFDRALKTKLTDEDYQRLADEFTPVVSASAD